MEPKIILLSFVISLYNTGSFAQNDTDYYDPTQHMNWRLLNQDNCGRSAQYRIIGGSDAELGQFPWVVRLAFRQKYYDDDMMKCGGTIINSKYILTAGHCFKALEKLAYVRVGELDEGTDPDCDEDVCAPPYTDYEIETITVHPDYDNPRLYSNDITLVRVKGEIKFNDFVAPICLEYGPLLDKDYVDEQVIVAGWGIFDLDLDETAKVLQYVSMPVVSKAVCNHKLQSKTTITDTQICAGGIKGKDSCGGDSGGPLMKVEVLNQVPRYYLLGIVSFGTKRCAKTTLPAVYTRVAKYLPWILDNIRP